MDASLTTSGTSDGGNHYNGGTGGNGGAAGYGNSGGGGGWLSAGGGYGGAKIYQGTGIGGTASGGEGGFGGVVLVNLTVLEVAVAILVAQEVGMVQEEEGPIILGQTNHPVCVQVMEMVV